VNGFRGVAPPSRKKPAPETTLDTIGSIRLYQHRHGYRFSLDAVLLASFVNVPRVRRIADLGAGSGVVGLLLAEKYPSASITLVEVQRGLHELSARNISLNGLDDRVRALRHDIRAINAEVIPRVDVVVSNPPFRRPGSGRLSLGEERAVARHELLLTFGELAAAAKRTLGARGRFFLVHHPERVPEILDILGEEGFQPKRLRFVHGNAAAEARIVLLEAVRQGRAGMRVEPPLFVYEEDGKTYTEEVRSMYG
jgi:tRNA1Val (adenine37-N6)-methyltransferase